MVGRLTSGCPWTNPSLNCIFCVCLKCNSSGISHIHLSTVFLKCISNNICIPNCIHMSTYFQLYFSNVFPTVFLNYISKCISWAGWELADLSLPMDQHHSSFPQGRKLLSLILSFYLFNPSFANIVTSSWMNSGLKLGVRYPKSGPKLNLNGSGAS